jgi:hypothetical protein
VAEQKKGLLEHPFYSRVLGSLAVAAILAIGGLVIGNWAWLWSVVTYAVPVPLWLLVVSVTVFLLMAVFFVSALASATKHESVRTPDPFKDYRQGIFHGVLWSWTYRGQQPYDPAAFCPDDSTPLTEHPNGSFENQATTFRCVACGRKFGPIPGRPERIKEAIGRVVCGHINSGRWRELIDESPSADLPAKAPSEKPDYY